MSAGSIVVDLLLKSGSFITDIDRTTKEGAKKFKEMQRSIESAGAAIGVAIGAGVAATALLTKKWIDGLDALNDIADATGASVENLSALEDIAVRTGTSMDSAAGALVKFNLGLKGTDDDGKAAKALEAIGLNIKKLREMDPAEALLQTAVALSKFADDGDKARLVQELFGKSVREMAPLLKDLAEKGQLVATVTTEQAKEAEAFNKEIFAMQKNVTDLGRGFAGDLATGINLAAKAFRENGDVWGAMKAMFGGTQQFKDNKQFVDLTNELLIAQNNLDRARTMAAKPWVFGGHESVDKWSAEVKRLNADLAQMQAARNVDTSFQRLEDRRLSGANRPGVGPVDTSKDKKGKDPDADFKSYLSNLQQQIQKIDELTVSEKLLDDIRRGSLTVSDKQREQLMVLAQTVDKEKEQIELRKLSREAAAAEGDAITKANEEYQELMKRLLDGGPAAQLEKQRKEMMLLAEAFERGAITAEQFNDAATGALGLDKQAEIDKTKSMAEELGMTFASAFEQAVVGGGDLSDVFKGLLQDIARVILRLGVIEPMMKKLKESLGDSGGSGSGSGIGGMLSSLFNGSGSGSGFGTGTSYGNMDFGGYFADGGSPPVGKPSIVGERGPEWFVPRTAGTIVPNHALGGGQDKITLINQTTGRVDKVVEQRISPTERALILQEARELVAADMQNPQSRLSRSMGRAYDVRRNR